MCLISKVATCGKLLNPTVSYADFAGCDRCCHCIAICDKMLRQSEGNGRKFIHLEQSVIS